MLNYIFINLYLTYYYNMIYLINCGTYNCVNTSDGWRLC